MTAGIYSKMLKVHAAVHRVPKNGRNEFHKYDYATEADLTDTLRPLMAEAGVLFFPTIESETKQGDVATVVLKVSFIDAEDGSSIIGRWLGEGQDKGDKAFYKAFTGAVKYALMKTFLVATGDDPELDDKPKQQQARTQQQRQAPGSQENTRQHSSAPVNAECEDLRCEIRKVAEKLHKTRGLEQRLQAMGDDPDALQAALTKLGELEAAQEGAQSA